MADQRPAQRMPQRLPPRVVVTSLNEFDYDESKRPHDMTYKWVRVTLGGQEDPRNQILHDMNGWTPVPADRHPEFRLPHGASRSTNQLSYLFNP